MIKGQNLFQKSYENENFDQDLAIDAIDCLNQAHKISFEIDTEVEAICHAHIGKMYYKGFKDTGRAKKNYLDCIRLLETLKPRLFND